MVIGFADAGFCMPSKKGKRNKDTGGLFFLNDILSSINCNLDRKMNLEELQIFLLLFADDGILFSQTHKHFNLC